MGGVHRDRQRQADRQAGRQTDTLCVCVDSNVTLSPQYMCESLCLVSLSIFLYQSVCLSVRLHVCMFVRMTVPPPSPLPFPAPCLSRSCLSLSPQAIAAGLHPHILLKNVEVHVEFAQASSGSYESLKEAGYAPIQSAVGKQACTPPLPLPKRCLTRTRTHTHTRTHAHTHTHTHTHTYTRLASLGNNSRAVH